MTQTVIADAPPGIQEVEYGQPCGEEEVEFGSRSESSRVLDCIEQSLENGGPAWGTLVGLSEEGDPIPYTYVARSESDVLVFQDTTKDNFGSQRWAAFGCRSLPRSIGTSRDCGKPTGVDENTPVEFLERPTLDYCGRLKGVTVEELPSTRLVSPALSCFYRAFEAGEPAELFAVSENEEGRVELYLRVTEEGTVERFADATALGLWYYQECERLIVDLELRGCSPSVELTP